MRDVTYDGEIDPPPASATAPSSWLPWATPRSTGTASTAPPTSPRPAALTVNRRLDLLSPRNPSSAHKLLINYAGNPRSKGFRADTIT